MGVESLRFNHRFAVHRIATLAGHLGLLLIKKLVGSCRSRKEKYGSVGHDAIHVEEDQLDLLGASFRHKAIVKDGTLKADIRCLFNGRIVTSKYAWHELFDQKLGNGLTVSADQERTFTGVAQHSQFQTSAGGASGGCFCRRRLSFFHPDLVALAGFFCVQLKGAPAFRAYVIETALRFARIDNVRAVALGATNNIFERKQAHACILSEWDSAPNARKA